MPRTHPIAVTTHGRYLVETASDGTARGLLVGFHGYGESAEAMLERLTALPGSNQWTVVSIQGLHRFYRSRSEQVVASWMTRQDRDLAIDDNVKYVAAVVEANARESRVILPVVFAGFSQGVAMAFRAACASTERVAAVLAVGGDIPPELSDDQLGRLPAALLARGAADEWYTTAKWEADKARLRTAGVEVLAVGFDGGHEWHPEVNRQAASLIQSAMTF
jgi:predicted esterase